MITRKKVSVLPIYMVGFVWLGYAMFFPLRTLIQYVLCAAVSLAGYTVGKALFPDQVYQTPSTAEGKPQESKQEETVEPQVASLRKEKDRAISELRRLNNAIPDEKISDQIDHLEEVTGKIIDQVIAKPEKKPQISRFLDYFLPTTLKLLNAYDRMDSTGISGSNIDTTKQKVEQMLATLCAAFDKQLDALFGDEALDISTDITVMENLLAQEGLSNGGADGPVLEL
ncbi:MAG: hypothetical protein HFF38_03660 [Lawsonibacter sp.]|nr:hypothetical protein [Lawsonibacter sp.]